MLSFLRRIRRKSFEENKMKKIILYALGEIFLVVIGILIAVQLNNWNTIRKLQLAESITLDRLYDDLTSDIRRYNFLDSAMNHHIKLCDSVIVLIEKQQTRQDRISILKIDAIEVFLLEASTITYDEMINTGRLYSLSDRKLRRLITLYYRQLKKWETYSEENSNRVRHAMNKLNIQDYWVLQSKLWNNRQIRPEQYKWLDQKNSEELKALEHLMYTSSTAQRRNSGNYQTIRSICESLINALEERSN